MPNTQPPHILVADDQPDVRLLLKVLINKANEGLYVVAEASSGGEAVTKADDFVVSNRLVSLMLAQASENQYLAAIFDDLLDEQGSEIYMRPVADYVAIDQPLTFWTIAESARLRGEIAIGYRRIRAGDADQRALGGVTVNPLKSEALTYLPEDRIIVLARE